MIAVVGMFAQTAVNGVPLLEYTTSAFSDIPDYSERAVGYFPVGI